MISTWLSTGHFQVIFADNCPHVALKVSEALYVSEILHWFVEEEGLLLGEELNKTYNVARDPVWFVWRLTPDLKDFVTNHMSFFTLLSDKTFSLILLDILTSDLTFWRDNIMFT